MIDWRSRKRLRKDLPFSLFSSLFSFILFFVLFQLEPFFSIHHNFIIFIFCLPLSFSFFFSFFFLTLFFLIILHLFSCSTSNQPFSKINQWVNWIQWNLCIHPFSHENFHLHYLDHLHSNLTRLTFRNRNLNISHNIFVSKLIHSLFRWQFNIQIWLLLKSN